MNLSTLRKESTLTVMTTKKQIPRAFLWIAAITTACIIGLYFRLYPLTHNVSSDAYEQGTMLVISKLRAAVAEQIARQYPEMPAAAREQLVNKQFNTIVREHNKDLRQAFDAAGQQIIAHSGEKKYYLLESDAYYFLALTREILEKGSFGSKTEGSKYFNPLMLAPVGYWQPQTWHPFVGAFVYKIIHFFNPDTDLMFGTGFTAIFLFIFVTAAFFFTAWSLGCGIFATFIASLFFVCAPIYLQRSTFANFDDDAYNMFFPIIIAGLLFQAFNHLKNIRRSILFIILASACMAFYARFWVGWGFIWGLASAGIFTAAAAAFIKERSSFKPTVLLLITLTLAPFIAVGLFFGFGEVWQTLLFAFGELKKFIFPVMKGWPDLFIVVGELKKCSLDSVIGLTGGPILFWGGILSLAWACVRTFLVYDTKTAKTAFLAIFFIVTLGLSLSAQRFTLLCLTPLALLFCLGIQETFDHRHAFIKTFFKNSPKAGTLLTAILAIILSVSTLEPVHHSQKEIRSMLSPIFNSAWERALTKLHDHSPENSVVNTWWSPGHFVKAIARRRVTFDGASINGEQGYWLTKVYLSQTENEALGILRMLNVSSNNAADFLEKRGFPLSTAVPLLLKATELSPQNAYSTYTRFLSIKDSEQLASMTHGTPPPSYVLIYNEIVEGNVLLGYLGKWNFKKIEDLNKNPQALKKVPSRGSPQYVDFIWSLVGGQYRQSPTLNPAGHSGSTIIFDNGVFLDTGTMSVSVKSSQFGTGIPQSIFYSDGNAVIEKKFPNATLAYSAIYFKDANGTPHCVLAERIIANSLIARMYYFEGIGLKHFKPFAHETDITGRTKIFIYEVKWD
jgi:hypothetical protein